MARAKGGLDTGPSGRSPALRGALMLDVANGSLRIRKWPRPRGKVKTAAEQERLDLFTAMQWASKFMSPTMFAQITDARKGTPILPRDVTTAMLSGTLMTIVTLEGKELWPVAGKNKVSDALDAITQTPGKLLRRGADGWEPADYPNVAAPPIYVAEITRNAAVNTTAAGWQRIPLNVVVSDSEGWADLANFGIKPAIPGWYLCIGRVRTNTAGPFTAAIGKNNVAWRAISDDNGAAQLAKSGAALIQVNGTTDVIDLQAFCTAIRAVTVGAFDTRLTVIGPMSA